MRQLPSQSAPNFMHGYYAEARGRKLTEIAPPAVNLFILSSGSAYTRPGFEDTEWDLGNANHAHEALWVSEYNVTFFASDNKLIYVDHEKSNVVYDSGLSLTAESTLSNFNGAIYVTNPTDGVYRVGLSRLDASALIAAVEVLIEDGTTYRFDTPSGTLRIKGTNETYTGRDDTDWKFTGMSLTQAYTSGDLVIQTKSITGAPKFKKAVFWEEAMHGFGPQTVTSNQTAKRTLFYGQFTAAGTWTQHESFSGGMSGTQTIGKKGVLRNIVETPDYLYEFTDDESYSIANADVNRATGARIPHIFSAKYSSQNHKCATQLNGRVIFIDLKNKRIIRSSPNVAGVLKTDERFDAPIRPLLARMNPLQPLALAYGWEEANYALFQLHIDGQLMTLIWDNNPIETNEGSSKGRWLPPVLNWQVKSYFTKNGALHGTDPYDDTVYQFAVTESDDGGDIESVWAGGIFEIVEGRSLSDFGTFEVSGGLTRGTDAVFAPKVNERDGKEKPISSTGLDFGSSSSVGEVPVGEAFTPRSGSAAEFAHFDKSLVVSPAKGRSFQPVIRCEGDGHAMKIDSWRLPKVKFYSSSVTSRT